MTKRPRGDRDIIMSYDTHRYIHLPQNPSRSSIYVTLHQSNLQELNDRPLSAKIMEAVFQLALQRWHLEAAAKRQLSPVKENEHLQQLLKKATIWWLTYTRPPTPPPPPIMVQTQPEHGSKYWLTSVRPAIPIFIYLCQIYHYSGHRGSNGN